MPDTPEPTRFPGGAMGLGPNNTYCLEITGEPADQFSSVPTRAAPCSGSNWMFFRRSGDIYTNTVYDLCLAPDASGTKVHAWKCSWRNDQQWVAVGNKFVQSIKPGLCMTVAPLQANQEITLTPCSQGDDPTQTVDTWHIGFLS
ncbi:Aste57867_13683 [Aphanomyces stellatus]|nr:hypothetical protein As57867_013633 [Aphanomyces stellatus]VFT90516.1 Aste57867_13683 [Aphanomyces stellatus]